MSKPTDDQIKQLDQLFQQEDLTYFEQGDLLLSIDPDDEILADLATRFDRTVATLKMRIRVSKAFPPARRSTKISWGVYKEAAKIKKAEDRYALIDTRSEWTLGAIESAVNDHMRKISLVDGRTEKQIKASGMNFGAVTVKGQLEGNLLTLDLSGVGRNLTNGQIVNLSSEKVLVAFTLA